VERSTRERALRIHSAVSASLCRPACRSLGAGRRTPLHNLAVPACAPPRAERRRTRINANDGHAPTNATAVAQIVNLPERRWPIGVTAGCQPAVPGIRSCAAGPQADAVVASPLWAPWPPVRVPAGIVASRGPRRTVPLQAVATDLRFRDCWHPPASLLHLRPSARICGQSRSTKNETMKLC
jgi:hypothetical protein